MERGGGGRKVRGDEKRVGRGMKGWGRWMKGDRKENQGEEKMRNAV